MRVGWPFILVLCQMIRSSSTACLNHWCSMTGTLLSCRGCGLCWELFSRAERDACSSHWFSLAVSVYMVEELRSPPPPLSWIIFLIPFLPWVLNFIGGLWKDVGLAFSLLALSGLALRTPSLGKLALALALAFYAVNLRYNAVFSSFPNSNVSAP